MVSTKKCGATKNGFKYCFDNKIAEQIKHSPYARLRNLRHIYEAEQYLFPDLVNLPVSAVLLSGLASSSSWLSSNSQSSASSPVSADSASLLLRLTASTGTWTALPTKWRSSAVVFCFNSVKSTYRRILVDNQANHRITIWFMPINQHHTKLTITKHSGCAALRSGGIPVLRDSPSPLVRRRGGGNCSSTWNFWLWPYASSHRSRALVCSSISGGWTHHLSRFVSSRCRCHPLLLSYLLISNVNESWTPLLLPSFSIYRFPTLNAPLVSPSHSLHLVVFKFLPECLSLYRFL